jgi:transcriptional regulator with XRE-family HTH domain
VVASGSLVCVSPAEGVLEVNEEKTSLAYAKRVGERLRAIRKQKDLSLQDVEQASREEFKASVLGAYERGERAISVPRLQRLAKFYNVPVDRLLPGDVPLEGGSDVIDLDAEGEPTRRVFRDDDERIRIDLQRLDIIESPERELLSRYLHQIQMQRQDYNGRVLTIRREDLRAIACMFELTPELLRRRLDDLGVRLAS